MGNQPNQQVTENYSNVSIPKQEMERYEQSTHYSKNEIKQLYKQFYTEVPQGYIFKQDFYQVTQILGIKNNFITELLFNAFDFENDQKISFFEFICSMSVMAKGNFDEKIHFTFRMYDLNKDGFISYNEMLAIVTELYKMMGDLITLQGESFDTPTKLVDKIFEMNLANNGNISFHEFYHGIKKDPSIMNMFGVFY